MTDLIRPYEPRDREGCLAVFDSNTPRFFAVSERADYAGFLELGEPYQVIERSGRIVACGGHAVVRAGTTATLRWGMVARDLHGTCLGQALTEARLAAARATPGVTAVWMDTSQHTEGFYRRYGFETHEVTPDGLAPGIDKYEMRLDLAR